MHHTAHRNNSSSYHLSHDLGDLQRLRLRAFILVGKQDLENVDRGPVEGRRCVELKSEVNIHPLLSRCK